ncbi:DUF680 domain-containing protein [Mesorhizobium sp. A556]
MKTIALTTAALLVAAGSAFAASDHFQAPSAQSSTNVDSTYTSSVKSSVNPSVYVGQPVADTADSRTHWGNN